MQAVDTVKRVVLTGGSSGIGLAAVQAFLDAGYEVINISRGHCPLSSPRLTSMAVDLTDSAATREAVMTAAQSPATTIVHCAGAIREHAGLGRRIGSPLGESEHRIAKGARPLCGFVSD